MESPELDPLLHQASRLRIMTTLFKSRELAVTSLRDALGLTDGNLASHLAKLEAGAYVKTGRVLSGLTFQAHVKITEAGSAAFQRYVAALRRILDGGETPGPAFATSQPMLDSPGSPAAKQP